jgi:AAA domain
VCVSVVGMEFRAVFISTVRSRHLAQTMRCDAGGEFGFLSEQKLLNTALTRAKSWLGVVGDPVALCSLGDCCQIWIQFLKHCEMLGGITPKDLKLEDIWVQVKQTERPLESGMFVTAAAPLVELEDSRNSPFHSSVPVGQDFASSAAGLHSKIRQPTVESVANEPLLNEESWPSLTPAFEKRIVQDKLTEAAYVGQPVEAAANKLMQAKADSRKERDDVMSFRDWSLDYQLEPDDIIRQLAKVR